MKTLRFRPQAKAPLMALALASVLTCGPASATLTAITGPDSAPLVYSSVSNVTWTRDANLLGSMISSEGYEATVLKILTGYTLRTMNGPSWSDGHILGFADFSQASPGKVTWWGAMAFAQYLNHVGYGGSTEWQLPTVSQETFGGDLIANGQTPGEEMFELQRAELLGQANASMPDTNFFQNEQITPYWLAQEYTGTPSLRAWRWNNMQASQSPQPKTGLGYAWAISPGQVSSVPEPEGIALTLSGLAVLGAWSRRRTVRSSSAGRMSH